MPTQDILDRREAHRANIAFDISLMSGSEAGHQFYTGLIKDMSAGGLFIASRDTLPAIGETFPIRFAFPPVVVQPVEVVVEVRWHRTDEDNQDYPPGIGVKFIDLSPELAVKISTFVADKDVLLWDDDEYSEWGDETGA